MADRSVAGTNQWNERNAEKVGGVGARLYPMQDPVTGQWGWTHNPTEADGIVGESDGQLGVDEDFTTGGPVVLDYNGTVIAMIES